MPWSLAALFQPWKPLLPTSILNLTQLHMLPTYTNSQSTSLEKGNQRESRCWYTERYNWNSNHRETCRMVFPNGYSYQEKWQALSHNWSTETECSVLSRDTASHPFIWHVRSIPTQKKTIPRVLMNFMQLKLVRLVIKQQHLFQNGEGIAVIVYLKGT